MTPLTPERQALVESSLGDARRLALYYLRRRTHLLHLRDELLSHAYEGVVHAAATWRPELGGWRQWWPRVVWTSLVHLSRNAQAFRVSPRAWRAGRRPPPVVHLDAVVAGTGGVTVASTLVCPRPLASEGLAYLDVQAARAYLLERAGARPRRQGQRTGPEALVARWWRVRVEGAQMDEVGDAEGVSRQAVQQSVAQLDGWLEEWAQQVRREAA